jgi:hypothetical protein
MDAYAKLGVDLVEIAPMGPDPVAFVSELGDRIVPRLAQIVCRPGTGGRSRPWNHARDRRRLGVLFERCAGLGKLKAYPRASGML